MILALVVLLFVAAAAQRQAQQQQPPPAPLGREYWERTAHEDLLRSLDVKLNTRVAKNIIIFIGDGMGPNTATAARIYRKGENSLLYWESFPHVGAAKTYTEDKIVTDSSQAATALFTGVKANYHVVGLSAGVQHEDCAAAQNPEYHLTHITTHAQNAGKATGIVTTSRVTDATPAGMFARIPNRDWECDVPTDKDRCKNIKDIGRQLIEDLPGRDFNVIMGGGALVLQHNLSATPLEMEESCRRMDGRDLIDEWAKDKQARQKKYAVVNDTRSLLGVDYSQTDYLMGIFAKNFLPYHHERDASLNGTPSLQQMAIAAIKVLMNNENGFLLMVENEHVDIAHHRAFVRRALSEVVSLHDTVKATKEFLEDAGILEETLLIVTSDHSHTLSIAGYPIRGNSILGMAGVDFYGKPYTALSYAVGGPATFHFTVEGGNATRKDPSLTDTTAWDYRFIAPITAEQNYHGGHDVLIYALGPYAHLFHNMHEQNYVQYVMKYAARLGEYANVTDPTSSSSRTMSSALLPVLISVAFYKLVTS